MYSAFIRVIKRLFLRQFVAEADCSKKREKIGEKRGRNEAGGRRSGGVEVAQLASAEAHLATLQRQIKNISHIFTVIKQHLP
jgi:hypothetical protein